MPLKSESNSMVARVAEDSVRIEGFAPASESEAVGKAALEVLASGEGVPSGRLHLGDAILDG